MNVRVGRSQHESGSASFGIKYTKPIQFKENIALVLKYFDKLTPLMQESFRPAD